MTSLTEYKRRKHPVIVNAMTNQEEVFEMIRAEREHQDEEWGTQRHLHPSDWYLILSEELVGGPET